MPKAQIGFLFVPFPREIWDKNLELSLGEFRLFGYLLRHQMRFSVDKPFRITDEELQYGRKKGKDQRYDKGCGLSLNAIKVARKRLLKRGWIKVDEDLRDKARPQRFYLVEVDDGEVSNFDTQLSENDSTLSKNDSTLSESDTRSDSREIKKRDIEEVLYVSSENAPDGGQQEVDPFDLFPSLPAPTRTAKPKASKADPRSSSPEILLYRSITGRYPSRAHYEHVIRCLAGHTLESASPYYDGKGIGWLTWARDRKLTPGKKPGLNASLATELERAKHSGREIMPGVYRME